MPQETQALVANSNPTTTVVKPRSKEHAQHLAARQASREAQQALTAVQPILAAMRATYSKAAAGPGPAYVPNSNVTVDVTMNEAVDWLKGVRESVNAIPNTPNFVRLHGYLTGLVTAFALGVGDQGERTILKSELRVIRKLITRTMRAAKRQVNAELHWVRAQAAMQANAIEISVNGFITPTNLRRARAHLDKLEETMVAQHEKRRAAKASQGNQAAS